VGELVGPGVGDPRVEIEKDLLAAGASPDRVVSRGQLDANGAALAVVLATLTPVAALSQNGRLTTDQFGLLSDRLKSSGSFKVRLQAALLLGAAGGSEAEPSSSRP